MLGIIIYSGNATKELDGLDKLFSNNTFLIANVVIMSVKLIS